MDPSLDSNSTFAYQQTDRVLSIQSHVSFGYVGSKAAVFPLQCLGFDVDAVNTVNFSNHSGYGRFGGNRMSAADLRAVFDGMKQNELFVQKRLVTGQSELNSEMHLLKISFREGYIPGAEGLSAVLELVRELKSRNPELIYVLDPVMGDSGRLYVAADVIPVYRSMLALATVITPNWFEVETLTGAEIKDISSLRQAFKVLHREYRCPNAVMSSIPLKTWLLELLPAKIRPDTSDPSQEYLICIASSGNDTADDASSTVYAQCVPLIPGYFSGVGDLFSALVIGHYRPEYGGKALAISASLALSKTHAILTRTHEYALTLPEEDQQASDEEKDRADLLRKTRRMKGRELRIIQSIDIIQGSGGSTALPEWEGFWSQ
ncbi:hypothetical protein ONZ45_g4815 [Pleurotus djamor]|nr:hypothetical protein ONZ45_g4815 [Pleurotus djamor]